MKSIDIRYKHDMSVTKARKTVQGLVEHLGNKHGVRWHWQDNDLLFERGGVKGAIHLLPHEVHVRAELGWLMKSYKEAMEEHIKRYLDQNLGHG